jgi:cell division protein FtsZ
MEDFINMFPNNGQGNPIIKVIGVGGAGGNAVNYMYEQGIVGVGFVVCNTDVKDLQKSPIEHKLQIGKKLTGGLGAGSKPERGRQAAEENIEEITAMLTDVKMVFVVAGMGGGTGTGATPVIAKTAKDMGILTVAVVTTPYAYEKKRYNNAMHSVDELTPNVDAILIIKNDKITETYKNLTIKASENKGNELVYAAVRGTAEIMTRTGDHSVDFADVESVMKDSGLTLMGTGRANGEDRADVAVKQAIESPLLDCKIAGAKGLLVNIVQGNKEMLVSEQQKIIESITNTTGDDIDLKYGVATDPELGEDITVTIIVTGFEKAKVAEPPVPVKPTTPPTIIKDPTMSEVIDGDYDEYPQPYVVAFQSKNKKPILMDESIPESQKSIPAVVRQFIQNNAKRKGRTSNANDAPQFAFDANGRFGDSTAAVLRNNPD